MLPRQFDRTAKDEVIRIFKQRSRAEWLEAFVSTDGCVEPVLSFEEALAHSQVRARGFVREEDGRVVGLNSPFVFAHREARPAPGLGEHTRDILGEFLTPEEMHELTQERIIGKKERGSA